MKIAARQYSILSLLCLALYLPGLWTLPPVDRDEVRFAQASRQMVEQRNWFDIRFQEETRYKKPPGIYWLQAISLSVTGQKDSGQIWKYRLPSLLGAWLAVLALFTAARKVLSARAAWLAAVLLASAVLLVAEAHIATSDAALLAAIVMSQGALAFIYVSERDQRRPGTVPPLVFWGALAAGILIKGPVPPLIAMLTIGALVVADRDIRWLRALRPGIGILGVACITCCWAIPLARASGGTFFYESLRTDLLPKLISGQENHGFPPGFYLFLFPVFFWPGSLFFGLGLCHAWKERGTAIVRFALAWLLPFWLLFELIPTKLPHYLLPILPAAALLTARGMDFAIESSRMFLHRQLLARFSFFTGGLSFFLFALGIALLPWFLTARLDPIALIVSISLVIVGGYVLHSAWSGTLGKAFAGAIVASLICSAGLFQLLLPGLDPLWTAVAVKQIIDREKVPESTPILVSGFDEPSLVFLLGRRAKLASGPDALPAAQPALAIVSEENEKSFFPDWSKEKQPARLGTVRGFNYNKGTWVRLGVYLVAAPEM